MSALSTNFRQVSSYEPFSRSINTAAGVKSIDLDSSVKPKEIEDKPEGSFNPRDKFKKYKFMASIFSKHFSSFWKKVQDRSELSAYQKSIASMVEQTAPKIDFHRALRKIRLAATKSYKDNFLDPIAQQIEEIPCFRFRTRPEMANFEIFSGAETMIESIFRTAATIPKLFKEATGKIIDVETYRQAVRSSYQFINDLSSVHLPIFARYIRPKLLVNSDKRITLDDKDVELVQRKDGDIVLNLRQERVEDIKSKVRNIFNGELSFGCPSHYAKTQDGKSNVLDDTFDWLMMLLDEYYFPYWDKLIKTDLD